MGYFLSSLTPDFSNIFEIVFSPITDFDLVAIINYKGYGIYEHRILLNGVWISSRKDKKSCCGTEKGQKRALSNGMNLQKKQSE